MRTFAVRNGHIGRDKLALFERMRADMDRMPDLDPDDRVSCHAVCRALATRHPEARCVDGHFMATGHEHSWLDIGGGVIADMYPIAGAVPFLVYADHWIIPWNRLYIPKEDLLGADMARHEEVAAILVAALEIERDRGGEPICEREEA